MAFDIHPDDTKIDPRVSCSDCEAVCCRLTVVLDAKDEIAEHLIVRGANGVNVMAHAEDGWCIALDRANKCCSIYAQRPLVCRRFAMGGGYCRFEREKFAAAQIPLRVA
ncbi:YkgJ family cysteine cluster protein [Dokdonella sp.]|uniref:YkgJ family cysteine cluster protein n=1 Tax=Dokdonella sp. TaxID=2291710 RepID=UPI003C66C263